MARRPSSASKTPAPAPEPKQEAVPLVSSFEIGGEWVYFIQLRMIDALKPGQPTLSTVKILTHREDITPERLDAMLREVEGIVHDVRVKKRRKILAEDRTPIPDTRKYSEECFRDDAAFFEAVLIDKFEFHVVRGKSAVASIESTVRNLPTEKPDVAPGSP